MRAGPHDSGQGWIALSDRGILDPGATETLLDAGLFIVEFTLPLQDSVVLLNHQSDIGWPRTFALFHDVNAGLSLVHRQGNVVARHILPGPVPQGRGTARLTFRFDAPARCWAMEFETLGGDPATRITAQGQNPLPLHSADVQAICTQAAVDPSVLWFGLTRGAVPPAATAWIGLRTPVPTRRGVLAAGNLQPGDMILTADRGPVALRGLSRLDLPARGSFAPVLLRAPFFGLHQDLLVSADQMVGISGPETEYLFGDEAVLMPAGALVDGRTALTDQRRAVTGSVALQTDQPALIEANGCLLAIGHDPAQRMPLRCLQGYEVLTLMSLLGRMPRRAA